MNNLNQQLGNVEKVTNPKQTQQLHEILLPKKQINQLHEILRNTEVEATPISTLELRVVCR